MKFYYSPGACSLASHIALEEAGADFDAIKVDLSKHETEDGEDFYAISPRGYVPAIDTEETGLLPEIPAVLTYISDRFDMSPKGADYYKMLEWIGFVGSEIHGAYHPLFGDASDAEKDAAREKLTKKYELATQLHEGGDWLVGDGPTVADNYLFVTTLWAGKMKVDLPDAVKSYRARNLERESVRRAMAAEGLR